MGYRPASAGTRRRHDDPPYGRWPLLGEPLPGRSDHRPCLFAGVGHSTFFDQRPARERVSRRTTPSVDRRTEQSVHKVLERGVGQTSPLSSRRSRGRREPLHRRCVHAAGRMPPRAADDVGHRAASWAAAGSSVMPARATPAQGCLLDHVGAGTHDVEARVATGDR